MGLGSFLKLLLILGCCAEVFCQDYDYYWRNYNGEIPKDAVEGGNETDKIYIGIVYVHRFGITPITIYPGMVSSKPSVPYEHWDKSIKILCSKHKNSFKWLPTDAKSLQTQALDKHLVRGGVEWGGAETNIGRISRQGEMIISKVCSFITDNALMYYYDEGREETADVYEILIYETKNHKKHHKRH